MSQRIGSLLQRGRSNEDFGRHEHERECGRPKGFGGSDLKHAGDCNDGWNGGRGADGWHRESETQEGCNGNAVRSWRTDQDEGCEMNGWLKVME